MDRNFQRSSYLENGWRLTLIRLSRASIVDQWDWEIFRVESFEFDKLFSNKTKISNVKHVPNSNEDRNELIFRLRSVKRIWENKKKTETLTMEFGKYFDPMRKVEKISSGKNCMAINREWFNHQNLFIQIFFFHPSSFSWLLRLIFRAGTWENIFR